jgi:hypothetical protein
MRNYAVILAVIVFAFAFLGVEVSASNALEKCKKDLRKIKSAVVFGKSDNAFKKNLAQDYCADFRKGGPRAGELGQANGKQIFTGICSNTPQGEIPKVEKMPSTIILSPENGSKIKKNKKFNVKVFTKNLDFGFFSDPEIQYNAFPQQLNMKGVIKGHQHITIQYLGDLKKPPKATDFSFFKGLNEVSKNGILNVEVSIGLPKKGTYRICTLIASFSHQSLVLVYIFISRFIIIII